MSIPIPAIDLIEGKCVRLSQGSYDKKVVYHDDPIDFARRVEGSGLTRLHVVDLDGARLGAIQNFRVVEKICNATSLHVDSGGGIQSEEDVRVLRECGVAQCSIGSIAIKKGEVFKEWITRFGASTFILCADVKGTCIAVSGWTEETKVEVVDFIKEYAEVGLTEILCTDISKDGLLQGPSFDLYRRILEQIPKTRLIASGGVASVQDVENLNELGVSGVIIGKALYEKKIGLGDLTRFMTRQVC
jgi:phosphoribosylformimino-5-aminoimidazole carboxamide ribotide isomerase